ncbi:MAG TPA: indole-3-glycerol phosphate synthase TrpC [Candidatus Dormibacteraeota bacterium]|nr:indole-3-glycerol phosphate synthase TrpC [Candidatus Dormibacteraeota bacterium]
MLKQLASASARQAEVRRKKLPIRELERKIQNRSRAKLSFTQALGQPGLSLIAEHKRRSPSKGDIRRGSNAAEIAKMYTRAGAAAISVLTEEGSFGGSLQDLADVRDSVDIPILRKDFITSQYQLYEAAAYGADAVLLIAAILSTKQLREIYAQARELGLDCLIEVHSEAELKRALEINPRIIGINNRNLKTFKVDIQTANLLRPMAPPGTLVVAESGYSCAQQLTELNIAGFDAVLIGEVLMRAKDPELKTRELLGTH